MDEGENNDDTSLYSLNIHIDKFDHLGDRILLGCL